MRDGTRIAVDLYLPEDLKQAERIPGMLHQTRYWRSVRLRWPATWFVDDLDAQGAFGELKRKFILNGYAWVDVDARGSGASFGHRPYEWSPDEVRDGAEIVDWIIRQPWSNGKVGTMGVSYGGTAAEFLLVNKHPAVKAAAPMFSLFDIYTDNTFPGGIHHINFTEKWAQVNNALDRNTLPGLGWWQKLWVKGVRPVDQEDGDRLLSTAILDHAANWDVHQSALRATFRDDTVYSSLSGTIDTFSPHTFVKEVDASAAAVYSYSGWFDGGYQHGAIKRYLTLTNPNNKLIIGPWNHGGQQNISPYAAVPVHENYIDATFDHAGELLKFFDYHLKGNNTGIKDEKPVHYFTMGEERWKATDTWPPKATIVHYYFTKNKSLSETRPFDASAWDTLGVDSTVGTGKLTRWSTLLGGVVLYEKEHARDSSLLYFTTSPLAEAVEVTGHPIVTLHLRSTATDGLFFVYLQDVDEKGRVWYVTEGMLRALHRKSSNDGSPYRQVVPYRSFKRSNAMPLQPGEIATLTFDLLPTSYQFKKEHSIRIAIACADKDNFKIIPEQIPTVEIYRDSVHASGIDLPVVKN